MTLRWVALATSCAAALICAISANVIVGRMVDEVNAHLSKDGRFSQYWWYGTKYMRLLREYRTFYPNGRRLRQLRLLSMGMCVSLGCAALAIGFGLLGAACLGVGGCTMVWLVHREWQVR